VLLLYIYTVLSGSHVLGVFHTMGLAAHTMGLAALTIGLAALLVEFLGLVAYLYAIHFVQVPLKRSSQGTVGNLK
jgi:hypothetical protein